MMRTITRTVTILFTVFIVILLYKSKAPTDYSADAGLIPILRLSCRISLWRILFLFRSLFPDLPEQFPDTADDLEK